MSGWIYVFGALNQNESDFSYYKIGVTSSPNLDKRISALQTGCPRKIKAVSAIEVNALKTAYVLEKHFHWKFSLLKSTGEWFQSSPAFLEFIHKGIFEYGENSYSLKKEIERCLVFDIPHERVNYIDMTDEEVRNYRDNFFGKLTTSLN